MMRIDKILCDIVAIEHGFQHILMGLIKSFRRTQRNSVLNLHLNY